MTNIELVAPIQQLKLSACLLIFCVEQLQSWTGLRWVLARSLYSHQFGKTLSLSLDLPILLRIWLVLSSQPGAYHEIHHARIRLLVQHVPALIWSWNAFHPQGRGDHHWSRWMGHWCWKHHFHQWCWRSMEMGNSIGIKRGFELSSSPLRLWQLWPLCLQGSCHR